jgi:hypothetical protein
MTNTLHARTVLPARQVHWTRLGAGMGYTHTEAKRAQIRAAVEAMCWVDPAQLGDVLDEAPVRFVVAGLFYQRRWALHAVAVAALPTDDLGRSRRLIGLDSVTGARHVLLDVGYEVIHLLTDTLTREVPS